MADATILKLRTPIQANGEQLAELSFRAPKGADIVVAGMPFARQEDAITGAVTAKYDAPALRQLISRQAGIPTSSVDAMDVRDWRDASAIVMGFFQD